MSKFRDRTGTNRSIKARLLTFWIVPCAIVLAIGTVVCGILITDGLRTRSMSVSELAVAKPIGRVLASLQEERRVSMLNLAGSTNEQVDLASARKQTDEALAAVAGKVTEATEQTEGAVRELAQNVKGQLDKLGATRAAVDSGQIQRADLAAYYNTLMDDAIELFDTQTLVAVDAEVSREHARATELFRAAELMSRANATILAAYASDEVTEADYQEFANLVGAYHAELSSALGESAPEAQRVNYQVLTGTAEWNTVADAEKALFERGSSADNAGTSSSSRNSQHRTSLPINQQDWQTAATKVAGNLFDLATAQAESAAQLGVRESTRSAMFTGIWLGFTWLSVTLVYAFMIRIWVELGRRMNTLREEVLDLADNRLPEVVKRLRDGADVDPSTDLHELDFGTDEIGQVANAFNKAHKTAVAAAVNEAQTREGVNTVFLGIAHRSQVIVHRQLKILDKVEREQEDPDQLEYLFQLDHLATRARRNAENLIILGGEQPGRQWRNPVRLMEIVRSAVAETEHYTRVRTGQIPGVALLGAVVADVIHLVAELVDNATSFSPPGSHVQVHGNTVAKGVVIEVEDRGLGMTEEDREKFNATLADPPDFGVMALTSDSRLGLFVVARLAARHGISVELRESAYGGTRAIVLLPAALLAVDTEPPGLLVTATSTPSNSSADDDATTVLPRVAPRRRDPANRRAGLRAVPEPTADQDTDAGREPERTTSLPTRTSSTGNGSSGNGSSGNSSGSGSAGNGSDPDDEYNFGLGPHSELGNFWTRHLKSLDGGDSGEPAESSRGQAVDDDHDQQATQQHTNLTPTDDDDATQITSTRGRSEWNIIRNGSVRDDHAVESGRDANRGGGRDSEENAEGAEPRFQENGRHSAFRTLEDDRSDSREGGDGGWRNGPQRSSAPAIRGEVPVENMPAGSGGQDTRPRLPQRKRQANLAPQLLESSTASAEESASTSSWRSPEEIRDMMSAFQRGSRQGRNADESEL